MLLMPETKKIVFALLRYLPRRDKSNIFVELENKAIKEFVV